MATQRFGKDHANWRTRGTNGRFQKQSPAVDIPVPIGPNAIGFGDTPVADVDPTEMPFVELGATGLRHFSGVIDEEFLPALRGRRAIQVFTEMKENDPTVGAMLFAVEMLMRQVEWRVEPAGTQPADLEIADFVDSCRLDMSDTWEDTIASIFSFLPFGFAVHEEVYKIRQGENPERPELNSNFDDGRIGWRKLPTRAQDTVHRWVFDEEQGDELRGMIQLPPPRFQFRAIPAEKFLLFRTTSAKANPQGRSILRNAYRPWYFKRRIEEIEGIGIERDLAGLPKMEVPAELLGSTASAPHKALLAEIRQMLRDIRRDEREGIIVPREFDAQNNPRYLFELVRSGGRRQFDTTLIVNRYDRSIASVVLADFILLGQQRVGAYSLADKKTELFAAALGAWLDSVTAIFNRVAIPRLLELNGMPTGDRPKLVHGDVETVDLTELGDYITKLSGAGMTLFPDEELENVLRSQGGLPDRPEDLDEPEPPPPPVPPQPFPPPPPPEPAEE